VIAYTTFNYSNLATTGTPKAGPESGPTIPGGASSLFEVVATVTATITNSGTVAAAEVAQLYLGLPSSAPDSPIRQLRGFDKISIKPGASATVKFELRGRDLSYWDVAAKKWVIPSGKFAVDVGSSSRDLRIMGPISVLLSRKSRLRTLQSES
jgi:beta-glucosidase